jgi:hypothetical protein
VGAPMHWACTNTLNREIGTLMSSGFHSQNGRWPDPKSSKQKGGAGYFPNYSIFCILLECCCYW